MLSARSEDGARRAWLPAVLVAGGYVALLLAVYWEVWWGGEGGRRLFGWDCLREYWPDVAYAMRSLGDGELPLWNPYALGGYAFFGDSQAGMLAPINWLLWLGGALGLGDGVWLIQAKVLCNLLIGLTGMHALVARRTGSHAAATLAAIVFVFGSPLLVHKNGALLWPLLYLPWAVLALERYAESPTVRRALVLAGAVWLCGSAGHPQGFFYGLVVLALYWLLLTFAGEHRPLAALRRQWPGALAAAVTTLLLLAPIYLPNAQAVGYSPRADRGVGYVMQGPLTPQALYELVLPNLDTNWQLDVYVGPLALVLAVFALLSARGQTLRQRIFWWGIALLGVLLAMGKHAPVLPFFYDHVPGFTLFRIAYRHKLIFGFAIAVLAGEGAASLARGEAARWARLAVSGVAALWLIVAIGARAGWWGAVDPGAPATAATWAIALGGGSLAAAVAAALDRRRAVVYAAAAVWLVMADLWVAGGRKLDILQPPPELAGDRALIATLDGVRDTWRFHNDGVVHYAVPYLYDVREMSGFLNPVEIARHREVTDRAKESPSILAHFNVRYWLSRRAPPPNAGLRRIDGPVWAFDDPAPILRVYPRAESLPAARMLERLAAPGALDAALVDPADAPPPLPAAAGRPVDGRVVSFRRNRLVLEVDAPWPGVAVINEAWFPGWRAQVNGREAPVFRANYFVRGVAVPGGRSRIVMWFGPRWYDALLIGFALALAAVGVAASGRWRRLDRSP